MRTQTLVTTLALALAGAGTACNWTEFDDLESSTWVHSTQDPDVGAANYGVAIVGVSSGTSGGQLAVLSEDAPNYSTIDYSGKGDADVGPNPIKLGTQNIGTLSDNPVFVSDGAGNIGLAERSVNGGNYAVLFGPAGSPTGLEFAAASNPATPPDAATYLPNGNFLFTAGGTMYQIAPTGGTTPPACPIVDGAAAPLELAAIAATDTTLVGWAKNGTVVSWQLTDIDACPATPLPAPFPFIFTSNLMPAAGARIHISGGNAILAGHAASARTGAVYVVEMSAGSQVGSTLSVDGLKSSELATFDSGTYVAVGIPDATVGSDNTAAGEVQLFAYDTTTGALDASAAATLYDAQPESNQQFGRGLAAVSFNGESILAVAADGEVFTYFRTSLYDHLP